MCICLYMGLGGIKMTKRLLLLVPAILFAGCNGDNSIKIQSKVSFDIIESTGQPIFYGKTSPTLYTGLTADQQNAIVSLCYNFTEHCFCTGTLISPHVVLTAGHCIYDEDGYTPGEDIEVRVGPDETQAKKTLAVSKSVYFNENNKNYYDSGDFNKDIAVLILKDGEYTIPKFDIKSGSVSSIVGHNAQIVGYGTTEISVYSYNPTNTKRLWTTMYVENFSEGQIHVQGYGETGVAPGDSGSPILYDFGDGIRVAGVASTSEPDGEYDWTWGANYTPVDIHENWIRGFVNQYDNEECLKACKTVECGKVGACSCGGCERGFECSASTNTCQKKPHGTGGVCWNLFGEYLRSECSGNDDCPDDQICTPDPYGGYRPVKICADECLPESCSTAEAGAMCVPFALEGGGYYDFCLEDNPRSCSYEGETCTTASGTMGTCISMTEGGALGCYGRCTTIETCEKSEACIPYDRCISVCLDKDCGTVEGCDCGSCRGSKVCSRDFECVLPEDITDEDITDAPSGCSCDFDTACSAHCACDPECPCECDTTTGCDCSCDADCRYESKKSGCNAAGGSPLALILAAGLWLVSRKRKTI